MNVQEYYRPTQHARAQYVQGLPALITASVIIFVIVRKVQLSVQFSYLQCIKIKLIYFIFTHIFYFVLHFSCLNGCVGWKLCSRLWAWNGLPLNTYTVRLLSFRTGIIKSIYVKVMTLLFCFRHTSLLNVHTDLHGHTASGCLCRSRPLQWCLMYLSRLSGCPKSSQRDAPSSGISLLGKKVISRC